MTGKEALTLVDTLLHSANQGQKLNNIQSVVFVETWAGRSYREIAQQLGYEYDYIKQIGSRLWRSLSQALGEEVSKQNIQAVLRRYQHSQTSRGKPPCFPSTQDWGEAIDVSLFYGRQAELQTLETWVVSDSPSGDNCATLREGLRPTRSRLIGIFGLGGIGKTALSVKLAQHIQSQFECIIWRSLQQAPPLDVILSEILPILADPEVTTDNSISALMKQLRQKRCLLVLDNVESVLQGGNRSGQYQPGYEAYRQLFERISDELHQSCLILTGREKPGGFAVREGKNLPVRSLQLQGLSAAEAQPILMDKGLDATEPQRLALVNSLGGNPLALKVAATSIQTLFGGNVQAFLAKGSNVYSDLWDLLDRQFDRLSPLQQQIMYWLAINREGVTPAKLHQEILPKVPWQKLLETLESLKGRSLIETVDASLIQQPVITEYVTERFIQTIEREILTNELNVFKTHALIETQTQDYIPDAHIQLILHPLSERLLTYFETQVQLEQHLCKILASLQHKTSMQTGYARRNLRNLFSHLKTGYRGFDFSYLSIRQAYLADTVLHDADFTGVKISQTLFAESFGGAVSVAFSYTDSVLPPATPKAKFKCGTLAPENNWCVVGDTNTGRRQLLLAQTDSNMPLLPQTFIERT